VSQPNLRLVPDKQVSITEQTDRWSEEVLLCRSMQHAWQQYSASYSQQYRYYSVEMQCTRCTTIKHQELDSRGRITASWYDYPEGYLSEAGYLDADARAVVRVASLRANLRTIKKGKPPVRKTTGGAS